MTTVKFPMEYICQGGETGCRLFALQPDIVLPIGDNAKRIVKSFLKDNTTLVGTDFYHLFNFGEGGFKNECPRVKLALSYAPMWSVDRLKTEGLEAYLKKVVE